MDQVANLLSRPKAYYNIDGLGELGMGLICLYFAFMQWEQMRSPAGSPWHGVLPFVLLYVLLAIIHYGTKAIKTHLTYPRTGFVQYRRWETTWRPAILGGTVSAAIPIAIFVVSKRHWNMSAAPLLFGLLFAALYAYRIARTAPWKWSIAAAMAVCALVIGSLPTDVAAGWLTTNPRLSVFARFAAVEMRYMAAYGALFFISGAISFWLYLRHTQPPAPEDE